MSSIDSRSRRRRKRKKKPVEPSIAEKLEKGVRGVFESIGLKSKEKQMGLRRRPRSVTDFGFAGSRRKK